MAYKNSDGRWIVEDGDKVYWRDEVDTLPTEYVLARVALIAADYVYLESGPRRKPHVWRELIGVAPAHLAPREGCYVQGNRVHFDWSEPPIIPAGYRKKAS